MKLLENIRTLLSENVIDLNSSLGMTRDEMPQIDQDQMESFLDYLSKNDCEVNELERSASTLKPCQKDLDVAKADKIWNDGNAYGTKIIISDDDYVLDGHHRWLAVLRNAEDDNMKVLHLSCPAEKALDLMKKFEGVKIRDIDDKQVSERLERLLKEDQEVLSSLSSSMISELQTDVENQAEDWPDDIFTVDIDEVEVNQSANKIIKDPKINSISIIDPYTIVSDHLDSYDKNIDKKNISESDYNEIFKGLKGQTYEVKTNVSLRNEEGDQGSADIFLSINVISLKYIKTKGIIEVTYKAKNFYI